MSSGHLDEPTTARQAVEPLLQVNLPVFEGPLDLLLHLIRKNRLNIYDIPISRITDDYLQSLDDMRSLNMEVAGYFLEMAATLALIKSRLLIPDEQPEDADDDPRLEVVRPLLLYVCMQQAALFLKARPMLGLDQFSSARSKKIMEEVAESIPAEPRPLEVSLYELLQAFWRLRKRSLPLQNYQITAERLSVTDRIQELLQFLKRSGVQSFQELCLACADREHLIVTFLALLEMIKSRIVRVWREGESQELVVASIEE